jgi:hypothetical protein
VIKKTRVIKYMNKTRVIIQENASNVRVEVHASGVKSEFGGQSFPGIMADSANAPAKYITNEDVIQLHSNQTVPIKESFPASSKNRIVKINTNPSAPRQTMYISTANTEGGVGPVLWFHTATLTKMALQITTKPKTT